MCFPFAWEMKNQEHHSALDSAANLRTISMCALAAHSNFNLPQRCHTGGSLLTLKGSFETLNEENLEAIASQLARIWQARPDLKFVIVHGAGSFGHFQVRVDHPFSLSANGKCRDLPGDIDLACFTQQPQLAMQLKRVSRSPSRRPTKAPRLAWQEDSILPIPGSFMQRYSQELGYCNNGQHHAA